MKEKRIALLVGISDYEFATRLKNPCSDIDKMQDVLSKLAFEVTALKNISLKQFKKSIHDFGNRLDGCDIGLFYFAGHGIQINGVNYLVPVDANPLNEKLVEFDCLNASRVLATLESGSNDTNFMFLDACRTNPFERAWHRSNVQEGLSYMSAPYGTLIAYSTAPNTTALDGEGENSPYTNALVKEILSPHLSILQVLQNVRKLLIHSTEGQQVPWESTSLLQDVIFNDGRYFSLGTFCQSIIYDQVSDKVLNLLKLNRWDLVRIPTLGIPISEEDEANGVIAVYIKTNFSIFECFDGLEIKIYENGSREYILFTSTDNAGDVISIVNQLHDAMGLGYYDDERKATFRDKKNILNIASNKAASYEEECFEMWIFEAVSFDLKYKIDPQRQLAFTTKISPAKKVVNGSIRKLLSKDYLKYIDQATITGSEKKDESLIEVFESTLDDQELYFFDVINIRRFTNLVSKKIGFSIYFKNSAGSIIDINNLSSLIAQITEIYGLDRLGDGYLSGLEEDNIKSKRHWSGRQWDLNIQHQIWDIESNIEEHLYGVHIDYDFDNEILELSIIGYDALMNYLNNSIQ